MEHSGPSIDSALSELPRRSEHGYSRYGVDEDSSEGRPILRDIERLGTPSTSTWSSENAPVSLSNATQSNEYAPRRQESSGQTGSDVDSLRRGPGLPQNELLMQSSSAHVSFQPIQPSSSTENEHTIPVSLPPRDFESLVARQQNIPSHRERDPPQLPKRDLVKGQIQGRFLAPKGKEPVENIIIVLHDNSGNKESLQEFATQHLRPRGTACLLLRGISPVKGKEGCYQWEDNLDSFLTTSWLILNEIISNLLIRQCNFPANKIILFGQGEGAAAALAAFLTWGNVKFGGVVCVGGQLPSHLPLLRGPKSKTAVLLLGGALGATSPEARTRIEQHFAYVDCDLMIGKDDSLPRDHQLDSLRDFFGHRLQEHEWNRPAIITFDGGGIKGYGSLLILQELMNKIGAEERRLDSQTDSSFHPYPYKPTSKYSLPRQKADFRATASSDPDSETSTIPVATSTAGLPDSSLFLPCHYFQYGGGTSTGGLISIMISRLRMTVDDCIEEYKTLGGDVFGKPRRFTLKTILWDKFNYKRLHDAIQDVTIRHCDASHITTKWPSPEDISRTTVVAYNDQGTSDDPYLLRTFETYPGYGPRRLIRRASSSRTLDVRNHGPPQDLSIPQVGRATTAAPGYFEHLTVKLGETTLRFKDGGFGCNNPSWEIYKDVLALLVYGSKDMGPFISIGTGISDVKLFPAANKSRIRHKIAEFKAATKGLPSRTMGTHENMMTAAWRDNKKRFHYSRFDGGRELGAMALDEWKPNDRSGKNKFMRGKHKCSGRDTLRKIEGAMRNYLAQKAVQEELDECAKILVRRRRLQIRDESRWDRFACASWYVCPYNRCPKQRHDTLEEFESHVRRHHPRKASEEDFDAKVQLARQCWLYHPRNGNVALSGLNEDPKDEPEQSAETAVMSPAE